MAATLEIDELNRTGVTTHGVVNLNVGGVDAPNITVTPAVAVRQGQNAFVKYHRLHFTDLNGASTVSNIRVWISAGAFRAGEAVKTNLGSPGFAYLPETYATPTTATYTGNPAPVADPGGTNLAIGGSLLGTLVAPGVSDVWKWQLQVANNCAPGATTAKTFTFQWDET